MKKLLSGFFIIGAVLAPVASAEQATDIMQCVRANAPDTVSVRRITLTTTGRGGQTRTIAGRVYATREGGQGGSKMRAMLQVDEPEQLDGASYLVRDTDDYLRDGMFVYLPAVGRVRRVTGTFADGSLMGTTFSYFDFKQFANAFGDLEPSLQGSDSLRGRDVHVLRFTPVAGAETRYTAVQAWIDRKSCLPIKVDFIEDGTAIKRFTAPVGAIQQVAGRWYLDVLRLKDLRDESVSVLRVQEVTLNGAISSQHFDPESFYQVQ